MSAISRVFTALSVVAGLTTAAPVFADGLDKDIKAALDAAIRDAKTEVVAGRAAEEAKNAALAKEIAIREQKRADFKNAMDTNVIPGLTYIQQLSDGKFDFHTDTGSDGIVIRTNLNCVAPTKVVDPSHKNGTYGRGFSVRMTFEGKASFRSVEADLTTPAGVAELLGAVAECAVRQALIPTQ